MIQNDHELNRLLAKVAGVEIWWSGGPLCVYLFEDSNGNPIEWSPLHDANQMERVEETLVKAGLLFKVGWYGSQYEAWAGTEIDPMGAADGEFGFNKDKKRAFALAIYAMEQGKEEK